MLIPMFPLFGLVPGSLNQAAGLSLKELVQGSRGVIELPFIKTGPRAIRTTGQVEKASMDVQAGVSASLTFNRARCRVNIKRPNDPGVLSSEKLPVAPPSVEILALESSEGSLSGGFHQVQEALRFGLAPLRTKGGKLHRETLGKRQDGIVPGDTFAPTIDQPFLAVEVDSQGESRERFFLNGLTNVQSQIGKGESGTEDPRRSLGNLGVVEIITGYAGPHARRVVVEGIL